MTDMVLKKFSTNAKVVVENNDNAMFSKDSIIKLDTKKMQSLGWIPMVNLSNMYEKLIQSYKEKIEE